MLKLSSWEAREGEEKKRVGLSNLGSLQGLENNLSSSLFQPLCKAACIQEGLFISLCNGWCLPRQVLSRRPWVERRLKWIHWGHPTPHCAPERGWRDDIMLGALTRHLSCWEKQSWEGQIPEMIHLSVSHVRAWRRRAQAGEGGLGRTGEERQVCGQSWERRGRRGGLRGKFSSKTAEI